VDINLTQPPVLPPGDLDQTASSDVRLVPPPSELGRNIRTYPLWFRPIPAELCRRRSLRRYTFFAIPCIM